MTEIPCPPHTFFITLRLADRTSDRLVQQIGALRGALRATIGALPLQVVAATVLPAATHMIWTLPADDQGLAPRIAMLKRRFAQITAQAENAAQPGLGPLWHRDHWACRLETATALARHQRLIHHAAVEVGLCARPEEWPYCSYHREKGRSGLVARAQAPTKTPRGFQLETTRRAVPKSLLVKQP